MSSGTFQGAEASAALAAGVFLVSSQQAGDCARVSTPVRHCFFNIYHYHRLLHCAVLDLSK